MLFVERALFLKITAAAFFTGGLDVWSPPDASTAATMRVLISDDRGNEIPQLADGDMFTFANRRWRGAPSIVALPGGKSGVVATVGIDEYLYGVLPIEASPGWPPGALAAQSIVARTFALEHRTLSRPYDVAISQRDQRFGGIDAEYPATNAAVDATRSTVLSFDGAEASVFYAACCGGHTADAAAIWGHNTLPYLRGVPDPYCVTAPDYRWERSLPRDRMQAALAGHVSAQITGFDLGPPDSGGRPLCVDVICGTQRATLSMVDFRNALGTDTVRSTWIRSLRLDPGQLIVDGAGRGHGVGFCQWGARAMGAAGAGPPDILAFYFPGTRTATLGAGAR
jgi:stage II sporulation protein D